MRSPKLVESFNARDVALENRRHKRRPPPTNAVMLDTVEQALRAKLDRLFQEHRDLDGAIWELTSGPCCDQQLIARLKKRKLHLKDEIARLGGGDVQSHAATVLMTTREARAKQSHPKSMK